MPVSHCTRCGSAIQDGVFCSSCGARLGDQIPSPGPVLDSQAALSTPAWAAPDLAGHHGRTPFLLTVVGVLTVLVVALAVVVARGSGSKPAAVQAASAGADPASEKPSPTEAPSTTNSTTSTAPTTATPPKTSPPPRPRGRADALAVIAARGMREYDSRGWDDAHTLNAIQAVAVNAANPRGAQFFFFANGDFVGNDDLTSHEAEGSFTSATDDSVTVTYARYAPGDGLCCPSQGAEQVTYHWDGSRLTAARSATIPPSTTTTTWAPAPSGSGRSYRVTHDVAIREGPGTSSPSVGQIPADTWVVVSCVTEGEVINDIWGADPYWDFVNYNGVAGYVTDEWVDTQSDVRNRSILPACLVHD